jgi:hypothetical protein
VSLAGSLALRQDGLVGGCGQREEWFEQGNDERKGRGQWFASMPVAGLGRRVWLSGEWRVRVMLDEEAPQVRRRQDERLQSTTRRRGQWTRAPAA